MINDDTKRGEGIEDPDTSVETSPFQIDDEATVETGSMPPPAYGDDEVVFGEGAPTDRPPPMDGAEAGAAHFSGLRTPSEIAALVEEARGLVEPMARTIHRRIGGKADLEELNAVGRFALVEAARTFDPARSRFAPYAQQRLKWAMFDQLRRDARRRGTGRRGTALAVAERVLEARIEPPTGATLPTEETARASLADAFASHASALAVGLVLGHGGGGGGASGQMDLSPDSTMNPERAVGERRNIERLRAAIAALPDNQRALVERHYVGDERFDHIAESLGVSKSWASRLHAQAMAALARALGNR